VSCGGRESPGEELVEAFPGGAVDAEVSCEDVDGLRWHPVEVREVGDHRHAPGEPCRRVGQLFESGIVGAPVDGAVVAAEHRYILGVVQQGGTRG